MIQMVPDDLISAEKLSRRRELFHSTVIAAAKIDERSSSVQCQ